MKKILFVLLVLSVFTVNAQVPSYVPSNGLVAYYPFNGNANDASGNGNNVISNNGASLSMDRHGNKNKAYYLTPGTNLTVAHNANLNVSSNYTIALWYNLKTDIFPASDILIKGPNDWSGNVYFLRQSSITNQKNIAFVNGSDNPFPYVVDSMPVMNQWHFIVINISNSLASFYIDNRLVDTTSFPGMTNMANNNSPLKLGGGYYQFEGQLDDIGFWNRSLTTSEMTSLYNAPPTCPTSSSITNITIPSSSLPYTWNGYTLSGSGTVTTFFTNIAGCDSAATLNLKVTYDIPYHIPTSGLVGYWPFNGNTDDNSGNGNYVVRNDGGASPTTDRFGNSNKAYLFGGRQQLNIPHKSTLNISPNYCISLWVNILSNSSPAGDLLMKGPNDWQGNVFFLRQGTRDANNANISLVSGAVAPFQNVYDSVLTLNQWHLLVINITNSVASFYVDNILTDTTTLPQLQNMVNNQSVLKFGGAYYGFNGKLDDIVFWNRSLTRPEITALYTGVPSCIANITNNDTTICKSSSVTLSAATATGNTYLWSNNVTTSTITVSPIVTTKYYCTVKNGTTTCKDSVTISVSMIATNIITVDTVKACGTSTTISAIAGLSSYAWSNGRNTQSTVVTTSGWYKCTATNGACTAKDSVYVSLFNPKITQNDTTVCAGSSLTMNLNTFVPTSVSDIDGNQYPVSKIGTQLWLGQNLRTSRFANGDTIPEINNGTTWYFTTNTSSPARCSVDLNPSNDNGYGRLYNFYAITDNRNVCPIDWHASTDEEWNTMVKYIDPAAFVDTIANQSTNASYKLRDTLQQYWPYSGVGAATNQTGFSARAAGARQYYGNFYGVGNYAVYWTTKSLSQFHGYYRLIGGGNAGGINRGYTLGIDNKSNGYSVRCLRNQPAILQNSTYLWSTGATTPSIIVAPNVTTSYIATVSNGINTCKDTVKITVNALPTNIITTDTVKVCGTTTTVTANAGFATYNWSNGANTASTTISTSGWYKCTVTNAAGCSGKDSVYVSLFNPKILQNDTIICSGSNFVINIMPNYNGTINDIDGNTYPTIQYGNQIWMSENLKTTRYANGDSISVINDGPTWYNTTSTRIGARAEVGGNINNSQVYGKLYNFYSTQDSRNVCPLNWHVPSDSEWAEFVKNIDPNASSNIIGNQSTFAGKYLKDSNPAYWSGYYPPTPNSATNQFNFNIRGTGQRGYYGNYYNVGEGSAYWTSTPAGLYSGYAHGVGGTDGAIARFSPSGIDNGSNGFPLRCVKNSNAVSNTINYLWSTGATTPSIIVAPNVTTSYIATVSNGINTCKDTVKITVTTINANFITLDTVKACGTSTTVNATTGFASYSWSNGANTASTTVTSSGWYKCTVTNGACTAKDSVYVSLFNPKIIQNDTMVCAGSNLTLSVNASASSSALPNNLRNGLVGYWPFNGNANDESGNGNNGTVNGPLLSTDRFGNSNRAYWFDGINDFIDCGSSPSFNLGNYTITAWVKILPTSDLKSILSSESYTNGNKAGLIFNIGDGDSLTGGHNGYGCPNNFLKLDSNWTFVALTYNGTELIKYRMLNNISCNYNILPRASNESIKFGITTAPWTFGRLCAFKGLIDDISIWNRALSNVELQQVSIGASSYLWSTGATTPSITVTPTATTSYIATVSNGINTCKDTVKIYIHPTPLVPAAIQKQFVPTSIIAVTNVSGLVSETYRIKKVANAVSYDWSLKRGNLASITHLNPLGVNDTAVTVTFNACFLRDTLCVKSVGVCSSSVAKTAILYANTTPANVSAITTLGGNFAVCIGVLKSFTAVAATPTATQTNIGRYRWTLPANVAIASANADSSTINVQFNTGFAGGNIAVRGVNTCTGTLGAITSTTLQYLPPTPTSIVSGTGSNIACINNTISYSVLVAAPSISQTTASLFRWTKPANTSIISASADSSSITLRFNAGFTGGVLSVKGQSSCGAQSAAKSFSLTSIGCKMSNTSYVVNNNTIRSQVRNSSTQNLEVQLYPNPSSGSFNLKINSDKLSPIVVKVMNINGQMVKSFLAKSNQINQIGSELKSGVYMVIIHQDDEEKVIKAVKM